ncbi:MAG: hypothetical protein BMS9Abin05_1604 [Rhodothermia bacterium]|nr:MAG: hypothetical protein BMS9Abin05_1604 [Rhodothermia bacterium]
MKDMGHPSSCFPSSVFDHWQLNTFSPAQEAGDDGRRYAHSIVDQFEEQVRRYPRRVAIESDNDIVTYNDLNGMANRIAHEIMEISSPSDQVVALLFNPGAWSVAALLGVSKAGKTWVAMNRSDPKSRLTSVLTDSTTTLLLTDSISAPKARSIAHPGISVSIVDEPNAVQSTENPEISFPSDQPACLIYTSGTTGVPKGVVHDHESLLRTTAHWYNVMQISSHDRFGMIASYSHIAGLNIVLRALLNGASLSVYHLTQKGTQNLTAWVRKNEITVLSLVPALYRVLIQGIQDGFELPNVRIIGLASDTVYPTDIVQFKRYFSDECRLLHNLGCTEVSGYRLFVFDKETTFDGPCVPVGFAVENKEVRLLNEQGEEVEPGEVGEIVVRSQYCSLGYWNRPDLTNSAFELHEDGSRTYRTGDLGKMLPDDCLIHMGRKDRQVQIRGNRVELKEIETALQTHPGISIAAIHPQISRKNEVFLTAYVQAAPTSRTEEKTVPRLTTDGLRIFLTDTLPAYMIPSVFKVIDSVPLTANGKVDFRALSSVEARDLKKDTPHAAPTTQMENIFVSIYREVLQVDQIGINDDVFDMGVTSLSLMRIASRIRDIFDEELPFSLLYENPTIAEAAKVFLSRSPHLPTGRELFSEQISPSTALSANDIRLKNRSKYVV